MCQQWIPLSSQFFIEIYAAHVCLYIGECWCHIQNAGSVRHIISKVILRRRRRHMHRKYLLSPNDLVARRAIVHTSAYKYGYGKGASPRRRFTCKLMFVQKTLFFVYTCEIYRKNVVQRSGLISQCSSAAAAATHFFSIAKDNKVKLISVKKKV